MKKKIAVLVMFGLSLQLLAGCEKTPDDVIVTQKNKDNVSNYETTEETEDEIQKQVEAPEHYSNTIISDDGKLTIETDADIMVPKAASVDTIQVTKMEFGQKMMDKIIKTFFGDSKVYDGSTYYNPSKPELEQKIALLKKYLAEGNMDPYEQGVDEKGNYVYDINSMIEMYEGMYDEAPDEVTKKEVKPQFGLPIPNEKGEEALTDDDHFLGVVEMDGKTYNCNFTNDNEFSQLFEAEIKLNKNDLVKDPNKLNMWVEAGPYLKAKSSQKFKTTEEELKKMAGISFEDAKALADSKVKALEFKDMELYDWDYSLFYEAEGPMNPDNIMISRNHE